MADFYRIKDWSSRYETNETRKLKSLSWVKLNNRMDGLAFRLLSKRKDGPTIFCAWVLMLELASKSTPRGDLSHNNLPLSPGEMGEITGFPGEIFENAIKFLCDPKIGWIERISPSPGTPGENPGTPGKSPETPPVDEMRGEEKEERRGKVRFAPPSLFEVSEFCKAEGFRMNPQSFFGYYSSNGWRVGKNPMKDWKAAARGWEAREFGSPRAQGWMPEAKNGNDAAAADILRTMGEG